MYTGQGIVIGVGVIGGYHQGIRHLVGTFLNTAEHIVIYRGGRCLPRESYAVDERPLCGALRGCELLYAGCLVEIKLRAVDIYGKELYGVADVEVGITLIYPDTILIMCTW